VTVRSRFPAGNTVETVGAVDSLDSILCGEVTEETLKLKLYTRGISASVQLLALRTNAVVMAMPVDGDTATLPPLGGVLMAMSTSAAPVARPSFASSLNR
jgi:hypothetical protein